jgi:hypothetical protein
MLYESAPWMGSMRQPSAEEQQQRGTLALRRVTYPVASVQEKMRRAGLPTRLITRLAYGW